MTYNYPPATSSGSSTITSQTLTPTGTTETIDWDNGEYVNLVCTSATGNITLTLNNPKNPYTYLLNLTQGASPRDIIFPAGTRQGGGVLGNTVYGVANARQLLSVVYDGSYYVNVDTFE